MKYGRTYNAVLSNLQKDRVRYPFRLVRAHSVSPHPHRIDSNIYGPFCRYASKHGDEWLFKNKLGRDTFMAKYGGTILGDQ